MYFSFVSSTFYRENLKTDVVVLSLKCYLNGPVQNRCPLLLLRKVYSRNRVLVVDFSLGTSDSVLTR